MTAWISKPDVTDFAKLKSETIPKLLGLMCSYVSQVCLFVLTDSNWWLSEPGPPPVQIPQVGTNGCLQSGDTRKVTIKGAGFYRVSGTPKCRIRPRAGGDWQEFLATFDETATEATCEVTVILLLVDII